MEALPPPQPERPQGEAHFSVMPNSAEAHTVIMALQFSGDQLSAARRSGDPAAERQALKDQQELWNLGQALRGNEQKPVVISGGPLNAVTRGLADIFANEPTERSQATALLSKAVAAVREERLEELRRQDENAELRSRDQDPDPSINFKREDQEL